MQCCTVRSDNSGLMGIDPADELGSGNEPILSSDLTNERPTRTIPKNPSGRPVKSFRRLFNCYPVALFVVRFGFSSAGAVVPGELRLSQQKCAGRGNPDSCENTGRVPIEDPDFTGISRQFLQPRDCEQTRHRQPSRYTS